MGELMKTERILDRNLSNLFAVLMSLCNTDTKNQVESMIGNNLLQRKDLLLKTVADAYRILARWKNRYGKRDIRINNANGGIAVVTTGLQRDKKYEKGKRLHVMNLRNRALFKHM